MERIETIELLAKVKAGWFKQPVDELVLGEWFECLAKMQLGDAKNAVRELRDSGIKDPPTPGEVLRGAIVWRRRRQERERANRRLLDEPPHTPEQIAFARNAVAKLLEDTTKAIEERRELQIEHLPERPRIVPDEETHRAQQRILERRRQDREGRDKQK